MKEGDIYFDIYGVAWTLRRVGYYPWYVWNEKLGRGLWDHGKGLTLAP